ncbi:uncharacterized protein LOC118438152 [Folsomia candida]|uniref:Uncharacterized protein n=1 Tax=Folsomia candida TaxID=158441 RepID=A0A226DH80_FOLCA|nr:uncharacterized protein LOC118438152 [Folsomia candida]OXA44529.1 hypothetical protein Fcan01_20451 [Folsomia candida]
MRIKELHIIYSHKFVIYFFRHRNVQICLQFNPTMFKTTLIVITLQFFGKYKVNCQTFIRDCNDPLIQQHSNNAQFELHSFCYHSCGYDLMVVPQPDQGVCTAAGLCQCNYPCGSAPPTNIFGDQCPPHVVDPADPNPNALPDCIADCGRLCTGGTGRICGEVYMAPIPGTTDGFAKICTCYCPPQPCVTRGVALVPVVLPNKKAVLTKKILKLTKLGILLAKFCAMYWLKILLCCLYFCLTHSCPSPWKVMDGGWGWGYQ